MASSLSSSSASAAQAAGTANAIVLLDGAAKAAATDTIPSAAAAAAKKRKGTDEKAHRAYHRTHYRALPPYPSPSSMAPIGAAGAAAAPFSLLPSALSLPPLSLAAPGPGEAGALVGFSSNRLPLALPLPPLSLAAPGPGEAGALGGFSSNRLPPALSLPPLSSAAPGPGEAGVLGGFLFNQLPPALPRPQFPPSLRGAAGAAAAPGSSSPQFPFAALFPLPVPRNSLATSAAAEYKASSDKSEKERLGDASVPGEWCFGSSRPGRYSLKTVEARTAEFVLHHGFLQFGGHNYSLSFLGKGEFKAAFTLKPGQTQLLAPYLNEQLVIKVYNLKSRTFLESSTGITTMTKNQFGQSEQLRQKLTAEEGITAAFILNDPLHDGFFIQRRVIASKKITPKAFVDAVCQVKKREDIATLPPLLQDILVKIRTFFTKAALLATPIDLPILDNIIFEEKGDEIVPTLIDFLEIEDYYPGDFPGPFARVAQSISAWSRNNPVIREFYLEEIRKLAEEGNPNCNAVLFICCPSAPPVLAGAAAAAQAAPAGPQPPALPAPSSD